MTENLRYNEPKLPQWWDLFIIPLTIFALVILVMDISGAISETYNQTIEALDLGFCFVFLLDFLWRMQRATSKPLFLKKNWIDLIAAIPAIDWLRMGRFVRLVRLIRVLVLARRTLRYINLPRSTAALGYLGAITVMIWFLAGAAFYFFESEKNQNVKVFGDTLWWSITTLSTVGYGDISPVTGAGRLIAALTMLLGIGILASFAGAVASLFIEVRELRTRGLRGYKMKEHFLILGWNDKAKIALEQLCHDTRYKDAKILIVADLETTPIDEPRVRFVRGCPGYREVLSRASAEQASVAIILASTPNDPRADHETALTALTLRRLNPKVRISAELVNPANKEHLTNAGCDAIIEPVSLAASLLVRGVLDVGTSDLIVDLLNVDIGVNLQRIPLAPEFLNKSYREMIHAMLDRSITVLGIARSKEIMVQPDQKTILKEGDEVFIVSHQ